MSRATVGLEQRGDQQRGDEGEDDELDGADDPHQHPERARRAPAAASPPRPRPARPRGRRRRARAGGERTGPWVWWWSRAARLVHLVPVPSPGGEVSGTTGVPTATVVDACSFATSARRASNRSPISVSRTPTRPSHCGTLDMIASSPESPSAHPSPQSLLSLGSSCPHPTVHGAKPLHRRTVRGFAKVETTERGRRGSLSTSCWPARSTTRRTGCRSGRPCS